MFHPISRTQPRHGKGTWADKESLSLKNQWLQHLVLASPERETEGVRLTAVPGLAGVKSLDPDSFMGLAAEMSAAYNKKVKDSTRCSSMFTIFM